MECLRCLSERSGDPAIGAPLNVEPLQLRRSSFNSDERLMRPFSGGYSSHPLKGVVGFASDLFTDCRSECTNSHVPMVY